MQPNEDRTSAEYLIREAVARGAKLLPDSISKLTLAVDNEYEWDWVFHYLAGCEAGDYCTPISGAHGICLNLMASMELTEYGVSVRGAWLTDAGREALRFLREHGCDWERQGEWVDSQGCSYGNS